MFQWRILWAGLLFILFLLCSINISAVEFPPHIDGDELVKIRPGVCEGDILVMMEEYASGRRDFMLADSRLIVVYIHPFVWLLQPDKSIERLSLDEATKKYPGQVCDNAKRIVNADKTF